MTRNLYVDDILVESWDDESRTYTEYDEAGEVISSRPYTDAENAAADAAVAAEQERAEQEAHEQAQRALVTATLALSEQAHTDGQAWAQPTGPGTAYPLGATVTHDGKTFTSLVPFNVWEPGDLSNPVHFTLWRDETPIPGNDWDPNGHAYSVGDEVTFEGKTYRCAQAHTSQPGWTPAAVPALWTVL